MSRSPTHSSTSTVVVTLATRNKIARLERLGEIQLPPTPANLFLGDPLRRSLPEFHLFSAKVFLIPSTIFWL